MGSDAQDVSVTLRSARDGNTRGLFRMRPAEHHHPSPGKYVAVATVLCLLTIIEVGVYYVEALKNILVPVLLILSAAKFSLVVLFYMHLKFDSRLFSVLFVCGLVLAGSLGISLLFLFRVFGA